MSPLEILYEELQDREIVLLADYKVGTITNPEYDIRCHELALCIVRVQQLLLKGKRV
jgi:hypothetical protein